MKVKNKIKTSFLILFTVYIFLSAIIAHPHGAQLAYRVQYPIVFQIAEALEEAGWQEFEISRPLEIAMTGPFIYHIRYTESTSHGVMNVFLYLGENAPEWAEAAYDSITANESNPEPGYAIATLPLSDREALVLKDLPDRIEKTARTIPHSVEPAEPNRSELWEILLGYGQTKFQLSDNLAASAREAFLFLLEPGRRLLLAVLLLLPLSAMSVAFQVWRGVFLLIPGGYLLVACVKKVKNSNTVLTRMDKEIRNLYLLHLLAPGAVLMVFLLLLSFMNSFVAILMLIALEILLNLRYPLAGFKRYYFVNALGVLIYTSIFILWHRNMPSFQQHWLLTYNGILVVILAPLLGYGLRKIMLDRRQTIYLAHMLMPGLIMLILRVTGNTTIDGPNFVILVLLIMVWQIYGSVGMTKRNFWKFYLADVVGLMLLFIIFSYPEFFIMWFPDWLKHNQETILFIFLIPLFGLLGGWIRVNNKFAPIDDGQRVNQHEKSDPSEKE
jgi:hypothetical protein